jgi:hypothetical protein
LLIIGTGLSSEPVINKLGATWVGAIQDPKYRQGFGTADGQMIILAERSGCNLKQYRKTI